MTTPPSLDSLRTDVQRCSGRGFAFLLANGLGGITARVIGLLVGTKLAAYALLFQGGVTLPLAVRLMILAAAWRLRMTTATAQPA